MAHKEGALRRYSSVVSTIGREHDEMALYIGEILGGPEQVNRDFNLRTTEVVKEIASLRDKLTTATDGKVNAVFHFFIFMAASIVRTLKDSKSVASSRRTAGWKSASRYPRRPSMRLETSHPVT
jgi:hypothetical protein